MTEWLDLALAYDPVARRSDLVLGADGDLVMDETPATPMLISLGSDRRARPDDPLPNPPPQAGEGVEARSAETGGIEWSGGGEPTSLMVRRGWPGDALDAARRPIGSRLWLLERAKASELTRRFCEEWAREALAWVLAETGRAARVSAEWIAASVLALSCSVDGRTVTINRRVS